jgi:hypothetical protein
MASVGLLVAATSCTSFSTDAEPDGGVGSDAAVAETSSPPPDGDLPGDAAPTEGGDPDGGADASSKLIVFVTAIGYSVTTAAAADTICAAEAKGRLPGTFRGWFPDGSKTAPERIFGTSPQPRGPWFRPDLVEVAATQLAFVKADATPLLAPISVTATLETRNVSTWTGTRADGTRGIVCPQTVPTKGSSTSVGGAWTDDPGSFTANCGSSLSLYCFQVP